MWSGKVHKKLLCSNNIVLVVLACPLFNHFFSTIFFPFWKKKIIFLIIIWYVITNYKKIEKKKKYLTKLKIMSKLDNQMSRFWKKVARSFCKVLAYLTGWKTEYLIAQLRAGIWQKVGNVGPICWFYTPHFRITIQNQKSQNAKTSCISILYPVTYSVRPSVDAIEDDNAGLRIFLWNLEQYF